MTRFHRHISASSTKLLECQRAHRAVLFFRGAGLVTPNLRRHAQGTSRHFAGLVNERRGPCKVGPFKPAALQARTCGLLGSHRHPVAQVALKTPFHCAGAEWSAGAAGKVWPLSRGCLCHCVTLQVAGVCAFVPISIGEYYKARVARRCAWTSASLFSKTLAASGLLV